MSMLEPEYSSLSIRQQCEILGINRSNVYYVRKSTDEATLTLMRVVDEVYTKYPFFGTRQMSSYLRRSKGCDVGREQIRSIYKKLGLQSLSPGPHTSKPHPEHKVYPYLLRDIEIVANDQVWSTDITYLRLRNGFVYLMAIIDWYSRYVLDWELSISLEADFCIETLARVLKTSICEIFNTDQGAQFTSAGFTGLLLGQGIKISMDGKGRALDNVFVERLWRSVKYEKIYLQEWDTVREVRTALAEYFRFYNHERPHQGLGGETPASVYLV
jgi:putative transposase